MKRYGLVLLTLATLFVTAMTLHAAGWFGSRPAHARVTHNTGRQVDDHSVSIPTYYRTAGPRHWRDCLGQN
jgi:hypothetical protein